ncbi:MAG: thioredoxin [Cytophagales bacterium]|nr:thioredoxin [Cytophagales bacterium]
MSATTEITDQNFREQLKQSPLSMLDFWAEWCGPCKILSPIVDEIAERYRNKVLIGKVDVDKYQGISTEFGIRSIPTLLFFKGEKLVDKHIGAISKSALVQKIDEHLKNT